MLLSDGVQLLPVPLHLTGRLASLKSILGGAIMLIALMMMMMALQPEEVKPDCAGNTIEMRECLSQAINKAEARMNVYLAKALEINADRPKLGATLRRSQKAFEAYRDAECAAIAEDWSGGGTAGSLFILGCRQNLDDQRTLTIWTNWLVPMADSEPPILPKPEPILTD